MFLESNVVKKNLGQAKRSLDFSSPIENGDILHPDNIDTNVPANAQENLSQKSLIPMEDCMTVLNDDTGPKKRTLEDIFGGNYCLW